jgi:NAD(P)-dependent dehydrogenase (short-subunit alcohol dehydrogenase family)
MTQPTALIVGAGAGLSAALFDALAHALSEPEFVVYNASGRLRGPLVDLDPAAVQRAIAVTAYGSFLVSQAAARQMVPRGRGTILLTGASASTKGYAQSAPFVGPAAHQILRTRRACSNPTRSPRPAYSLPANRATYGRGKSNCGPGSSGSEPIVHLDAEAPTHT